MPLLWSLPWSCLLIASLISNLQLITKPVQAYVPAVPANSSSTPSLAGLDVTDNSTVSLTWYPNSTYETVISYQQYGKDSKGISKGALVRVSEDDLDGKPEETTNTPWIALINCDKNSTNNDLSEDIFSKVNDRGAIAALMYSNTSDGCLLNEEYTSTFQHIFDIFTAKKPSTAILIQSQFSNINYSYSLFNPTLLNNSADSVTAALPRTAENKSPFIIATLRAANATGEEAPDDPAAVPTTVYDPSPSPSQSSNNHNSGPSQSLAMIILYVIVSLVSALFIVVILSGAIRAFRHPDRYGPRLYDPGYDGDEAGGRSRAGGITQAILDTFPIVKFGRGNGAQSNGLPYARNQRVEMKEWEISGNGAGHAHSESMGEFLSPNERTTTNAQAKGKGKANRQSLNQIKESHRHLLVASDGSSTPTRRSSEAAHADTVQPTNQTDDNATNPANADAIGTNPPSATAPRNSNDAEDEDDTLDPAAIGRETCPICIVDFEEGDDLRVLPCEGHHRFHKDCVDPWLLELSTSCPICREDFQALENMASAGVEEEVEEEEDEQESQNRGSQDNRGNQESRSGTGGTRGSSRAGSSDQGREDDHFPENPVEDRQSSHGSRFSRYIRFAQKRRRRSLRDQTLAPPEQQSAYPSI